MLELKNCSFSYRNESPILKDISFRIENKDILAILGKNGVGKTTMLKCLTGLLKWDSGQVIVNDKVINLKEFINEIGYVPQTRMISFPYTVEEMILMGRAKKIGLFSLPSKKDKDKLDEVIEHLKMNHIRYKYCTELSGGQLQLVYIARAIISEPKLLILDEPESHLDFYNQLMVLNLIKNISSDKQISCIINTHFPEHALKISNKTLFLGTDEYIFGETKDLINKNNIKKFFNVDVEILSTNHNGNELKSIVTL